MRTLPRGRQEQIEYFEGHLPHWAPEPEAVGLTPAMVAELAARTEAARAAFAAAQAARRAAQAATAEYNRRVREMRALGGAMINSVRAFAQASGDPGVYTRAQVPPPAAPSRAPAPAAPEGIVTGLDRRGAITLRWRTRRPIPGAEVFTTIERQLDGAGPFVPIGATGGRRFTDATVPAGTRSAVYRLRAHRGGQSSPWAEPATVFLGVPQGEEEAAGGSGGVGAGRAAA